MGKVDLFKVSFEKRPSIYSPGEKLTGRVLIRARESFRAENVHVNLIGDTKVHWVEGESSESSKPNKKQDGKHFSSQESYFNIKVLLSQKKPKDENFTIAAGETSYYFEMQLPTNLPTSFEHSFGRIRYFAHARIDIPWETHINTIRMFSVVSPLDLNTNEILKEPYGVSGCKQVRCGPCKSSPIECQFSVNRCGFMPGESIVFDVNMANKSSSREITDLSVTLVQKIKYHVKRDFKKCFRRVAIVAYPKTIAPKTDEKWSSHLVIPPVCSSTNGKCRIIDVHYAVQCSFETDGFGSKPTCLSIPLTIGTKSLIADAKSTTPGAGRYEVCHFEPTKFHEDIKGEIIESDLNEFKPYYPYKLE